VLKVNTNECGLLASEPVLNLGSLSRQMDEIAFEKYGFKSFCRVPSPSMALYEANPKNAQDLMSETYSVVVDVGYSFAHVVPFVEEMPVNHAIRRVNVGGKLLTNYLKEVISYRAFNMMDETALIDQIKHQVCTTSLDFKTDLVESKKHTKENKFRLEYVLPSHMDGKTYGHIRDPKAKKNDEEQVLTLSNERVTVPELLFTPKLIGINQGGLAQAIAESIKACHPDLHGLLYQNIIVIGGSAKFPNFQQRLEKELRCLAPTNYKINYHAYTKDQDPINFAWKGGSRMVSSGAYDHYSLSKATYQEYGSDACKRKFYWYS